MIRTPLHFRKYGKNTVYLLNIMATFLTSYNNYVKPIEGGYANIKADKGGETYAGISRKFHPNWPGWTVIDSKKDVNGYIKWNSKFSELTPLVNQFYESLYTKNNFHKINNQAIADILFDWFVNSGYAAVNTRAPETFGVDEILNARFGFKLPIDSQFDSKTIDAINATDPVKLHAEIKKERKNYYNFLLSKDPSQLVFAKGWLARIDNFPDLSKGIAGGLFLLVALFIFILIK